MSWPRRRRRCTTTAAGGCGLGWWRP
ncbi:GCG_CRPN prefix-to-repeats domain-containing protein [Streptomyces sp. NPDC058372]